VSLCVFLLDKNEEKPVLRPWLESISKRSPANRKLLAGFKYSVFVANGSENDLIHLVSKFYSLSSHKYCGIPVLNIVFTLESC